MSRAAVAVVVLVVCLAGTSCTDDSGAAPPGATGTPTTSDPPTTSGPADGPPELPEAAKAKTTAGAKAFVQYYVDVLNYSWQELTSRRLHQISREGCLACRKVERLIERVAKAGGYQRGGEWSILAIGKVPGQPATSPTLLPLVKVQSGNWKRSRGGRVMPIKEHKTNVQMTLFWDDIGWKLDGILA